MVNIAVTNVFGLIQFGVVIERLPNGHAGVLDICTKFIIAHGKDDLRKMSENWPLKNSTNVVKFLIQQQLLDYTLPILTVWIDNDNDVNFIISELEAKGLDVLLCDYGEDAMGLLDKMIEKVDVDLDTCKKVMKLQQIMKMEKAKTPSVQIMEPSTSRPSTTELAPSSSSRGLVTLLSEDYRSFPLEKILSLEQDYQLEHFEYVEVAVECLIYNGVLADDFNSWWSNIRPLELEYYFLHHVGGRIISDWGFVAQKRHLGHNRYKYFCGGIKLHNNLNLANIDFPVTCTNCRHNFRIIVKLVNKTPCYEVETLDTNHVVDHVYIRWFRLGVLTVSSIHYFRLKDHMYDHYSLLTNDYPTVMEKIRLCFKSGTKSGLYCLIRCNQ